MFDVGSSELLLIIIVAVVVIGPKDLPRALYKIGQVVGKARAMSRHFRSGIDAMVREAEMEELEKKWAAENRRIMEQYPQAEPLPEPEYDASTVIGADKAATPLGQEALPESAPPAEKPA
ncbi:MAG: Sec-independent protein translocase protein TatB [Sphingobium sp.]|mgnify:CR=1 FL=1|jgi:sec-independent protein translocase protein TatB|nr:Sec-independent protein translocase protein TatB [Sphingobium sp.]MCI1271388.1 Sec-independent protein translocase protein TatB [Sphingobium sp.]MCI1754723.1 Sec-independent protein translocase protein TatB [Sphingobium sp.]MCI2053261.1 Sec-independent protein translocase protein TatB [Sphingobium sp.]